MAQKRKVRPVLKNWTREDRAVAAMTQPHEWEFDSAGVKHWTLQRCRRCGVTSEHPELFASECKPAEAEPVRVTNERLAAIVHRLANNSPVRWYADAKGNQTWSHAAIECYLRPAEDITFLVKDFMEAGFNLESSEAIGPFCKHRFEAERDIKR